MMKFQEWFVSFIWLQFYQDVKWIANPDKTVRNLVVHHLINFLLFLADIRAVFTFYALEYHDYRYFDYDILVAVINRNRSYDGYMCLLFALFFTYNAYVNYFLFIKFARAYSYGDRMTFYDLAVANTDDFIDSNRELLAPLRDWQRFRQQPIQYCRYALQFAKVVWKGDDIRFQRPLAICPNLSTRFRSRVFLLTMECEMIFTYWLFLYALMVSATLVYYGQIMAFEMNYSVLQIIWSELDILHWAYLGWLFFRFSITLICLSLIGDYSLAYKFDELNELLEQICRRCIALRLSPAKPIGKRQLPKFVRDLRHYHQHHLKTTLMVISGSDVWKSIFLAFLLANIPLNVYFISFIYFRTIKNDIDRIMLNAILVIQAIGSVLAMLPVAKACKALHGSAPYFLRLQQVLDQRNMILKLKHQTWHEVVNSDQVITFKAGALGSITYSSLFEFAFAYYGYLMFAFDLIKG